MNRTDHDLTLPIDTAWLRRKAPPDSRFHQLGLAELALDCERSAGFFLRLWRLRRGQRRADLMYTCPERDCWAIHRLNRRLASRRELAQLWLELTGLDWGSWP